MPKDWSKYAEDTPPASAGKWGEYAEDTGRGPLASKVKKKNRSIFEIASDESIPKEQRDREIIEKMGWKAEGITESENYVPGEIADRVVKKEDYRYNLGQAKGGTILSGLWEGVAGPARTLGVGAAHLKEAAGVGKTPSANRRRAEALANIDKMNYDYSTTDEKTGKGNTGQILAPIAGELIGTNKLGALIKGVRGVRAVSKALRNPVVQGAAQGVVQPSIIEGDEQGGSNFGTNTLKQGVFGGATAGVMTPVTGAVLDKVSKTRLGEYLGMKLAEGPITLEKLKAALEQKLGGKTPGEVAQEAQRAAASAKNKELSAAFAKTARRAKPGEVDTSGIMETLAKHKRQLGREWNIDDPVEAYLSELESRVAQNPVVIGKDVKDALTGGSTFFPGGTFKGGSEAGTTVSDLMREYKIAGAKMRQAYNKGGQDSAAGATSGLRGGLQYDLKSAIEKAVAEHDAEAAAGWKALRGRWQGEYKPFREGVSGKLLDTDNVDPNKTLNTLLSDTSGDDIRNLTRVPLPDGTRNALEFRKAEELKNIYDANVARPISPDTAGGGPSGLSSAIRDPNHASFMTSLGDSGFTSAMDEIASRGATASKVGGAASIAGLAGAMELGGSAMGAGGAGTLGGLLVGSRMPNYASRPVFRAMENPHIRRLLGFKYGLAPDSPELQKLVDSFMIQGTGLGASREWPSNPSQQPEEEEYQ